MRHFVRATFLLQGVLFATFYVASATADTLTTFKAGGELSEIAAPFPTAAMSGTITVDVTVGQLTAADVTFTDLIAPFGSVTLTHFAPSTPNPDMYNTEELSDLDGDYATFFFPYNPDYLMGYDGAAPYKIYTNVFDASEWTGGTFTPTGSVTTPEPASLAMSVMAILGFGAFACARFAKPLPRRKYFV